MYAVFHPTSSIHDIFISSSLGIKRCIQRHSARKDQRKFGSDYRSGEGAQFRCVVGIVGIQFPIAAPDSEYATAW